MQERDSGHWELAKESGLVHTLLSVPVRYTGICMFGTGMRSTHEHHACPGSRPGGRGNELRVSIGVRSRIRIDISHTVSLWSGPITCAI